MIEPFTEHSNLQMHCLPECRNTAAELLLLAEQPENKEKDTAIELQPAVSRQGTDRMEHRRREKRSESNSAASCKRSTPGELTNTFS